MATWIITHQAWLLALTGILISILGVNTILNRWQAIVLKNRKETSISTIGSNRPDFDLDNTSSHTPEH